MKKPIITRKGFDFWVDGKKHKSHDYKQDEQELVVCKCGNKTFWIYQPQGFCETNSICTKCLRSYCVHDG